MIYLDNSASTFKKPKEVTKAVLDGLTKYSGNPGRSGHNISLATSQQIEITREKVQKFLNTPQVVFTQNCTDALNLAIQGTFKQNGHVICSSNDHNSMTRPLFELSRQKGLELSVASPSQSGILTVDDIKKHLKPNTYMVALNHMSNVDGEIADIQKIGEFCAENSLIFLVDGAQSVGHIKIDMQKSYIDIMTLAPHKGLYTPQGVGVMAYTRKTKINPIRYGGTGTESINVYQPTDPPECFESGTLSTPNILGLGAGIDFVKNNFDLITKKIDDLSTYLNFELSNIPFVKVYTHPKNSFGIIGFNIKDFESSLVAQMLNDKFGICVRGGLHCAPLKHKHLGTVNQGIVRVSLCYFNTFTECEKLVRAVKVIAKM